MSLLKLQLWMEFNAKARERLYRKMSQLLKNGVSLDRSLEQIAAIEAKRKHTATAAVLRRWRNSIENGVNFGQCVAPFVPSSEALLLETGGNSGRLQEALVNAAESVAQQRRVKSAIVSSASYPVLLIVILLAALRSFSAQVRPAIHGARTARPPTGTVPPRSSYSLRRALRARVRTERTAGSVISNCAQSSS